MKERPAGIRGPRSWQLAVSLAKPPLHTAADTKCKRQLNARDSREAFIAYIHTHWSCVDTRTYQKGLGTLSKETGGGLQRKKRVAGLRTDSR